MTSRTNIVFKLLFCVIVAMMMPVATSAFPFINISTSEGLSNRHVSSMVIDADGYSWFATHSGIDKFNGTEFEHYLLKAHAEEVQPGGVFKGPENGVMAFGGNSIYRYNPDTDSFILKEGVRLPRNLRVIVAKYAENGRLWIGTSKGLYVYGPDNRLIRHFFDKQSIFDIAFHDGMYCFVATSKGIRKISHPADGKMAVQATFRSVDLKDERIQSLYCDNQTKTLWIGTFNGQLYTLDLSSNAPGRLLQQYARPIRRIVPVDTDRIWVGVDGDGIYVYNRFAHTPVEAFTRTGDAIHRYSGSSGVYDIVQDKDLVWICTYSNGILVYDRSMPVNRIFTETDLDPRHFGDAQVNCIYQDSRNRIWFGTNHGIMRYDPASESWRQFNMSPTDGGTVLTLKEDRNGNMWAGGFMMDVVYIDPSDNVKSPAVNDALKSKEFPKNVYAIHEDENGNLYFGGIIHTLAKYSPGNGTLESYPVRGIYQIISLSGHELLLATGNGIVKFNTRTSKIESKEPMLSRPILKCSVTRLCPDPGDRSRLWIGTESKGLMLLNLKTGKLRQFTTADGLSNMTVCGLEFDNNRRLWVSTENGLNCVSPEGRITPLTMAHGLPTRTMKARSHFRLASGQSVWGTPTGAFVLDPDEFTGLKQNLNLHFEKLLVSGMAAMPGHKNSPLVTNIDKTDVIRLAHDQNNFSISFCNVGFQNESSVKYSYMLEGFDDDWTPASSNRMAHYTNISPGKYTFRVRAIGSSDPDNTMERSVVVRVAQPWYNTVRAWICYIILFAVMAYIAWRLYRRWMSVRDSDQKVRFFVNLAHDLRTPLTLIKSPLQEIGTDQLNSDDRMALKLARKNADKLLNMVNQLLDFQKIERDAMSLKVEQTDIGNFLQEICCNFTQLANSKNITLKASGSGGTGYIDRKKITVIIDNLLSNAIKYTNSGGNVSVDWKLEGDSLEIKVTDDGIGIDTKEQKKLFNRFYRADNASNSAETGSGIGLLLTKKMAELHKGGVSVFSELNVGSTFIVSIPVSKERYHGNEILVHETKSEAVPTVTDDSGDQPDSRISLMLIEDNDELRMYLEHTLGRTYAVSSFATGDEALEKIKTVMPDFVLSDVMMPGISGLELCSRIKGDIETSHIPVILLTSLAEREDVIKGFNAGADDYITKPFDIFILNKKIASIIKARKTLNAKIIDNDVDEESTSGSVISEIDREFMHKVVTVIGDNLANEEFSVNDLAAEMAMSRSVFFKKIKAITQQNPQELIKAIKMKKAAELILENKYSIAEISYMTGFPNPKYFSTAFKKFHGVSPSKYAEEQNA